MKHILIRYIYKNFSYKEKFVGRNLSPIHWTYLILTNRLTRDEVRQYFKKLIYERYRIFVRPKQVQKGLDIAIT